MKPLELAYSKVPNMGDLLNEYIFECVFQVPYVHSESITKYEVTGIGSFMDMLFTGPEKEFNPIKTAIRNLVYHHCNNKCITWGTGFLEDYSSRRTGLIRNNVSFLAVRGRKTHECIEKITSQRINPIYGDGGILAPKIFEHRIPKKYKMGLIPHFREKDIKLVFDLKAANADLHIVDLQKNPIDVIKEIASCEYIYSSSLHGLILADGFRIPNMRIYMSSAPRGGSFKFDDYYSAYNLQIEPHVISSPDDLPGINSIIDNYIITDEMVTKMQNELYEVMKQYLSQRM